MKQKMADRKPDRVNDSEVTGSTALWGRGGKREEGGGVGGDYLSTDLTSRILLITHQMVWKK